MIISGLQKLTLLDFPGRTACTVFFHGCNLRCPFCHNAFLVTERDDGQGFSEEEFFSFLESRKGLLDGVAITGGEPLLQPEIRDFIYKIKEKGFAVKLDTNGTFPDVFSALVKDDLIDYAAVDIKNSKAKYPQTTGIASPDVHAVERTVEFLKNGSVDYEFRTTLVKGIHTADDIADIGRWISGAKRWFLQAFKDSGNLISPGLEGFSHDEYMSLLDTARHFVTNAQLRGV